jgi:hypothetical protein
MIVTKRFAALIAVTTSVAVTRTSAAQTAQRFSAQASALYVTLSGDAYSTLNNGPGFEAQLRFNPGAVSIGGGFQFSNHNIDTNALGAPIDGGIRLYGAFLEPRYVIAVSSATFAPYVSGRLAYLRQSLNLEGFDGSANGVQVNGGGGAIVRLSTNVNLDLGATFGYIDFGKSTVKDKSTGQETTTPDSDSGTNWVFRLGLAFGLGR